MLITNNTVKHPDFEITLKAGQDFLQHLNQDQQYWTLYKAMREFGKHLESINQLECVSHGSRPQIMSALDQSDAQYNGSELIISDQEVMQDWEYPLMHNLADIVTSKGGDILEIGFGMAISASKIVEQNINSYTVIECNPAVIERFEQWKSHYPNKEINLIVGRWQDVTEQLQQYDGIIFDAYPVDETDWFNNALNSCSYAEQFFAIAAAHLNKGGIFTYYTGEIDSISNEHQRQLFRYFSQFNVSVQPNLHPPADCTYWWNKTMAVVSAIK